MNSSAQYLKIVEWSEEDQCFVGRCPGLMFGGVHGDNEQEVYNELCEVAEEWIGIAQDDGSRLPEPTAGKEYSGNFVLRVDRELHKALSIKAKVEGLSLNSYCEKLLGRSVGPAASGWKAVKVGAKAGRKGDRAPRVAVPGFPTKKAAKRKAAKKRAAKGGSK